MGILAVPSKTVRNIEEYSGISVYRRSRRLPDDLDVLIRWGNTTEANEVETVLNQVEAIKRTSDKPLCRRILAEAGVAVPQDGTELPCIGRTKKHSRGRGFWFCQTPNDVWYAKERGAVYFSKFYPKSREFRVHIGGGKVLLYSEKLGDKFGTIIWNKDLSDFTFRHLRRSEWDIDIIRLAKKAIKAVGLDFGAVDIMADPTDPNLPRAVVSEINTAPALSPYGVRKYVEYFDKVLYELENATVV